MSLNPQIIRSGRPGRTSANLPRLSYSFIKLLTHLLYTYTLREVWEDDPVNVVAQVIVPLGDILN